MIPDHYTLAQARDHILTSSNLDPILGMVKITRTIRVRFIHTTGPEKDAELPDDMVVSTFRALASINMASLVIDDLGGGTKAQPRQPELV